MTPIFKIFKVTPDDTKSISASANEPHQHDFEELIIGKEGVLEHFIDFKNRTIEAPFVSFVTKGKVHRVRPIAMDGRCDFWVIRFRTEFIPETVFQLYSSFHEDAHFRMQADECFGRLDAICGMIFGEGRQVAPDLAVIRQLLSALFTSCCCSRLVHPLLDKAAR